MCPEFFNWIECIFFIIQDFWATWTCLEKQFSWKFSLYWNIFIFQDFWATCACPENTVCPEFTPLKYSLAFRIFEQVALALKKEFALKFFKLHGLPAPPRTPMEVVQAPTVFDQPFEIKAQNPGGWKPQNYSGTGRDPITNC